MSANRVIRERDSRRAKRLAKAPTYKPVGGFQLAPRELPMVRPGQLQPLMLYKPVDLSILGMLAALNPFGRRRR